MSHDAMILFIIIICTICLLLCCMLFLLRKSMYLVTVIGSSMSPQLVHGDRVLVFRWYPARRLHNGQVVVLTTSRNYLMSDPSRRTWYVKRIVAMGGDTFTQDTAPYPDADNDEHIRNKAQVDEAGRWSWHIPPGHVFACGDNRGGSIDSRTWGPIPTNQIIGIVLAKLSSTSVVPPESASRDIIPYKPLPSGEPAPDFHAETLNGENVTLDSYQGKALLLLFIASTNLSYQKIPAFLTLAKELAQHDITVVFVFDGTREAAHNLVERRPISQPILIASHRTHPLLKDYHIMGTPDHCLLDDRHIVRATGSPTRFNAATLLAALEHARSDLSQEELNA